MFDNLSDDGLYALHTQLHDEGRRLHERFMALPSAISDEAMVIHAKHAEISEAMRAVYDEAVRREQSAVADA